MHFLQQLSGQGLPFNRIEFDTVRMENRSREGGLYTSYDISLRDPVTKETLELPFAHVMTGGTFQADYHPDGDYFTRKPTKEAWLNVTFNYSDWYYKDGVFPDDRGIKCLDGMTGLESIAVLQGAIDALEAMTEELSLEEIEELAKQGCRGYWVPTRKNSLKPLYQLKTMAQLRPDGIWEVDS